MVGLVAITQCPHPFGWSIIKKRSGREGGRGRGEGVSGRSFSVHSQFRY